MKQFDLIVIGAGAGGLTSAYTAVGLGKNVLLIDKNKPGGECTWSGCIPSKGLINIAKEVHTTKKYVPEFSYDTKLVMNRVKEIIANVYSHETPEKLREANIQYLKGKPTFVDNKSIEINGEIYRGKSIIIATGSSPYIPPVEGLKDVDYLTNENIFELDELPKSIIILGGGAIGAELGQALNRLGVKVEILVLGNRILSRDDEELALELQDILIEEGVIIHKDVKIKRVNSENGINVEIITENIDKIISADKILVAHGRAANMHDLSLENAGIEVHKRGIVIDDKLRTTAKGVYCAGDIAGPFLFSHMANAQGIQAVQNAFLPFNRRMKYEDITWCIYTDPELANAGITESQARKKHGNNIKVYEYLYEDIDRAKATTKTNGKIKVICSGSGKIIGASILGDRAGELIGEIQAAKKNGIKLSKLANVIHPYPTYAESLGKLGKIALVDQIKNNMIVKMFRKE